MMKMPEPVQERLLSLDTPTVLNGVVCEPEDINPSYPVVIFLNSGIVHHIGTCRTSVLFARYLGSQGILSLRFDLSNIGDSPAWSNGPSNDQERVVQEVKAMMDGLERRYGVNRFILHGLCSGAQNGVKVAVLDERVIGLSGIDPFGFRTPQYYCHYYCRKFFRISPWKNLLLKVLKKALPFLFQASQTQPFSDNDRTIADSDIEWEYPPRSAVYDWHQTLVNRNLRFSYVYTGDWISEYCYEGQFFDMYKGIDFKNLADVKYKPEVSHIMAEPESQTYIMNRLLDFVKCFQKQYTT